MNLRFSRIILGSGVIMAAVLMFSTASIRFSKPVYATGGCCGPATGCPANNDGYQDGSCNFYTVGMPPSAFCGCLVGGVIIGTGDCSETGGGC